jgi:hypothetical protein
MVLGGMFIMAYNVRRTMLAGRESESASPQMQAA